MSPPRALPWWARLLLAAAFATLTAAFGWTAVPATAVVAGGLLAWWRRNRPAGNVALAACLAWAILLVHPVVGPGSGALGRSLGGLAGLGPAPATALAAALSLGLASVLAWSAAVLGEAVVSVLRGERSRRPPAAAPGRVTLPPSHDAPAPTAGPTAAAQP